MQDKWFIIINPVAGKGKAPEKALRLQQAMLAENLSFESCTTAHHNHAEELTINAIAHGFRKIVVVGGDGTINHTVNGILKSKQVDSKEILLAAIGAGRGNDFLRCFNFPKGEVHMAKLLKAGKNRIIDAGQVSYTQNGSQHNCFFINEVGTGFEAAVVEHVNKNKRFNNQYTYFYSLLVSLLNYRPSVTNYIIDGKSFSGKTFCISIGNCNYLGGGLQLNPLANPTDGLLTVSVINHMPLFTLLKAVRLLFNGKVYEHPKVDTFHCKEVRVDSEVPLSIEAEGELIGHTPLTVKILPEKISVLSIA